MAKRIGTKTLQLTSSPSVLGFAAVGAKKEKEGPLADYFDYLSDDSSFGEKTWEKAETLMQQKAIHLALQKCGVQKEQIDFLFAGDLLNQCIGSSFAARGQDIPFSPAPFLFFAFRTCFQKCGGMDKTIGKHGDRSS